MTFSMCQIWLSICWVLLKYFISTTLLFFNRNHVSFMILKDLKLQRSLWLIIAFLFFVTTITALLILILIILNFEINGLVIMLYLQSNVWGLIFLKLTWARMSVNHVNFVSCIDKLFRKVIGEQSTVRAHSYRLVWTNEDLIEINIFYCL